MTVGHPVAVTTQRAVAALAVLLALTVAATAPAGAHPRGDGGVAQRYLVTHAPGQAPAAQDLRARGADDVRAMRHTPGTVVVLASSRAARRIAGMRGVVEVERDRTARVQHHRADHCGGPTDQQPDHCHEDPQEPDDGDGGGGVTLPWGIERIEAPTAWQDATGSGVTVCVADTGIDKDHESLDHLDGRNFTTTHPLGRNVDPDAYDDGMGHGTHVAGTIAALDNGVGVTGVAPDADLLVAKVLLDDGSGSTSQIVEGLNWCADAGADVINMSFGMSGSSSVLATTMTQLVADGVVLVAASGNQGADSPLYPAAYPEVIAVGASDRDDLIASFSNRGEDLNAPGVDVRSTLPGDDYGTASGTSMAGPHVAGVAALLIEGAVSAPTAVRDALVDTAATIPGGLRVDAAAAVGSTG